MFSKGFVLESMKIILENNNCSFNDELYRQISETAMGIICAPKYATLKWDIFRSIFIIFANSNGEKNFKNLS